MSVISSQKGLLNRMHSSNSVHNSLRLMARYADVYLPRHVAKQLPRRLQRHQDAVAASTLTGQGGVHTGARKPGSGVTYRLQSIRNSGQAQML